ncbi:MAG TPA: 5'-nucleotidase C-terminal domain-containing protein [Exilispira sp.]|nr:5'-nucleotidase C-terminal domain-containing protein [Spirochaetota bacterium]HOV46336.1 5'-nucleotidase C-terminal domain-containing protein [Exilispira sp.]HQQ18739.1 5'-nucleotidase C-terminal domain-containing protein [Exilispira sp.]
MMRKIYAIVFISIIMLFFASCATVSVSQSSGPFQLVVLHTNDHHGHPLAFEYSPGKNVAGLPARATYVNEIKAQYDNVLVLDAGDINTGEPESFFFNAETDIVGYNYIGYDAMALGNHEFDNPLTVLQKQMKDATFPFLCANIKNKDGSYLAKPYIIKEINGVKVAIFGLTTSETKIVGNPKIVGDLIIEDEVEVAKKLVPELRKKADIVICLGHLGIYDTYGSQILAQKVSGIDLIIDGHSHTYLEKPIVVNNTPIVSAYQWGIYMGKAILTIDKKKIVNFEWSADPINVQKKNADGSLSYVTKQIPEDMALKTLLMPYKAKVEEVLAEEIGEATDTFSNADSRKRETEIGDLVADAMLSYVKDLGVSFAINNGGGIRADLPKGKITKKSIYTILPFSNTLVVLTLKGSDLIELFNFIATIPQGKGAFPQVSDGVSFTINYEKGTCENILVGGKPIDPDATYKVATNSYMATGGDGYVAFTKAINSYDTSMFQRDIMIEYIKTVKTVTPILKNRIKIIGTKTAMFFMNLLGIAA